MLKEVLSRSRPGWKTENPYAIHVSRNCRILTSCPTCTKLLFPILSLVRLPIPPLSRCAVEKTIQADVEATLTVLPLGCTGDGDQRSNTPYLPKIKVAPSARFH
jgi:hypothetical protein